MAKRAKPTSPTKPLVFLPGWVIGIRYYAYGKRLEGILGDLAKFRLSPEEGAKLFPDLARARRLTAFVSFRMPSATKAGEVADTIANELHPEAIRDGKEYTIVIKSFYSTKETD